MLKKLFTLITLSCLSLTLLAQDPLTRDVDAIRAGQDPVWVHLNGGALAFQVPPVIVNGITFVEVKALFEALDIELSWNGELRRVTGRAPNGNIIQMDIGKRIAYVNNSRHTLQASPFIATPYNRTMIPLSFVSSATGASVSWIGVPRTVDIWTNRSRDVWINRSWELAEYLWRGYYQFRNTPTGPGPIAYTRGTLFKDGYSVPVWLIGLSGTDLEAVENSGSAVGLYEDLLVGFFGAGNDYALAVRNLIFNQIPRGSKLILAGHSLGGMVAQQIAADPDIKNNYEVMHTITFGSPIIAPGQREGEVKRLADSEDYVPLLSLDGVITAGCCPEVEVSGLNGFNDPHNVSYRLDSVWGDYDALGRKWGDAAILFNSSMRRQAPAPIRN